MVNVKNGNAPKVTGCYVLNTIVQAGGFAVYGTANADIKAFENWRWNVCYSDETDYRALADDSYGQDGTEKQMSMGDFEALGYDFVNVWSWDAVSSAPVLKKVGCDETVTIK